jgi:hypothetical protein
MIRADIERRPDVLGRVYWENKRHQHSAWFHKRTHLFTPVAAHARWDGDEKAILVVSRLQNLRGGPNARVVEYKIEATFIWDGVLEEVDELE